MAKGLLGTTVAFNVSKVEKTKQCPSPDTHITNYICLKYGDNSLARGQHPQGTQAMLNSRSNLGNWPHRGRQGEALTSPLHFLTGERKKGRGV